MEGIKESSRRKVVAALRQFIEVDDHKVLGLCQMVGSALGGEGVGGHKIQLGGFHKDAEVKEGPEELTLRVGERRGPKAFVDTTRIDRDTWGTRLVESDWSALCQTFYDGVEQEDWEPMYNTLKKVRHITKVVERASLLWKLSDKKRAGGTWLRRKLARARSRTERKSGRTCGKCGRPLRRIL